MLLAQRGAGLVEPLTAAAVALSRHRGLDHSEGDALAVDVGDEVGLQGRDALELRRRDVGEVVLGRPAEEPPGALVLGRHADSADAVELDEPVVTLVDRLQLEHGLVAGVVEVPLLHQLGLEAIGLAPVGVQINGSDGQRRS